MNYFNFITKKIVIEQSTSIIFFLLIFHNVSYILIEKNAKNKKAQKKIRIK